MLSSAVDGMEGQSREKSGEAREREVKRERATAANFIV